MNRTTREDPKITAIKAVAPYIANGEIADTHMHMERVPGGGVNTIIRLPNQYGISVSEYPRTGRIELGRIVWSHPDADIASWDWEERQALINWAKETDILLALTSIAFLPNRFV